MTLQPAHVTPTQPPKPGAALERPGPSHEVVAGGSRYGDLKWDLTSLSGRPTVTWLTIDFGRAPENVREDLRHFLYLVLTTDTPVAALDRPVPTRARLTPTSVKSLWEDLRPFMDWIRDRGLRRLCDIGDEQLRDYAHAVQDAPVTQPTRARRLFAVTRLWLYAPYLPPSARIIQPFWERDGVDTILGPNQWSPENKTTPIHPATMSALLVWCLRILQDAPVITARHALRDQPGWEPDSRVELAWLDESTVGNPLRSRQLLSTAALIVTAYLTGMRADEVLSLQRGCCTPDPAGGFSIHGRTFKSAIAHGRAVPAGVDREHPWRAIQPVADAVTAMEALHDSSIIFPSSLFRRTRQTPITHAPPAVGGRTLSTQALIDWANMRALALGREHETIPGDPEGAVSLRRLRRTLAWFIYRRPRGRVALGIQYGHLHAATTDGYGSRASTGLRELFPLEEAFAVSNTLAQAAENLNTHPNVTGPATPRYRAAVDQYKALYAGVSLTARQASELSRNPSMRIYDSPGQVLACCFDPTKALCRRDVAASSIATTPDLTACDSRCANIARTDAHIDTLRRQVEQLHLEIANPATPEPLRPRLQLRAERHQTLIDAHNAGAHD